MSDTKTEGEVSEGDFFLETGKYVTRLEQERDAWKALAEDRNTRCIQLFDECAMWRSRAERLQKERDDLVTGAFTVQNVLTPEVLERAARVAYEHDNCEGMTPWDSGADTWRNDWRALTKAALLAVGFVEPECSRCRAGVCSEHRP